MVEAASADSRLEPAPHGSALAAVPTHGGCGFPDDPKQVLWERLLDELVEAGYKWFELGPYGYLPTDLTRLAAEVGRRGLKVSGGGVFGALHKRSAWEHDLAEARKVANLVHAMGGALLDISS